MASLLAFQFFKYNDILFILIQIESELIVFDSDEMSKRFDC